MTLGRMIYFFVDDQRLGGLSAKRYGTLFVWLDIIAFIVQLVGAAFTTQTNAAESTIMLGVHIYMGGIGLQEFFILVFTGLFIVLHRRMLREERLGLLDLDKVRRGSMNWRTLFYAIYASLFLITVCLCLYVHSHSIIGEILTQIRSVSFSVLRNMLEEPTSTIPPSRMNGTNMSGMPLQSSLLLSSYSSSIPAVSSLVRIRNSHVSAAKRKSNLSRKRKLQSVAKRKPRRRLVGV